MLFQKIYTKHAVRDLDAIDIDLVDGIRSKDRVRDQAEVFTAPREVNAMLDLIDASGEIEPTVSHLEPSCGDGAFLTEILQRKISWIDGRHADPAARAYWLMIALSTTVGIDVSLRNVRDAQRRLLDMCEPILARAPAVYRGIAEAVISSCVVAGDFLRSASGVVEGSAEWKRMKPGERNIHRIEREGDERVRIIRLAPLPHAAGYVLLTGAIAKDSRAESLGPIDFEHLAEQLGVLAECDGAELVGYEPDMAPYDRLGDVLAPCRA